MLFFEEALSCVHLIDTCLGRPTSLCFRQKKKKESEPDPILCFFKQRNNMATTNITRLMGTQGVQNKTVSISRDSTFIRLDFT